MLRYIIEYVFHVRTEGHRGYDYDHKPMLQVCKENGIIDFEVPEWNKEVFIKKAHNPEQVDGDFIDLRRELGNHTVALSKRTIRKYFDKPLTPEIIDEYEGVKINHVKALTTYRFNANAINQNRITFHYEYFYSSKDLFINAVANLGVLFGVDIDEGLGKASEFCKDKEQHYANAAEFMKKVKKMELYST